jgi:crotonobetainyl-CoA:carnitine CoA-transferase CaiB-like acyl-CoA transferase
VTSDASGAAAPGMRDAGGALADVRVLEIGDMIASQYCGKLLAGLGAEVLKVELPASSARDQAPPLAGDGQEPGASISFRYLNSAKSSLTLDLEKGDGLQIFRRLVSTADVVLESLAVDQLDRLGLTPAQLQELSAGLILVSVSWFGRSGPRSRHPGTDLTAAAASGYLFVTGDPDREPVVLGQQAQFQAGLQAAMNLLACLNAPQAAGQWLDISVQESMALMTVGGPADGHVSGFQQHRSGNRMAIKNGTNYIAILPCRDGSVLVSIIGQTGTGNFLRMTGASPDAVMADARARPSEHPALFDELCTAWLEGRTMAEAVRTADEFGLRWSEVNDPLDVVDNTHLASRCYFTTDPGGREPALTYPGRPFKAAPGMWRDAPAPALGSGNRHIYSGELQLEPDRLRRLKIQGAL